MSRVSDLVQDRELFCVEEDASVTDAARQMADLHVGAIVVMHREELCGVFSERDIMRRVIVDSRDPRQTRVRDVMTTDVVTVDECAALEEAMELMQVNNCRHLPVTRDNRVVGFLSMRDLMNYELASKTEELHQMRAYIAGSS